MEGSKAEIIAALQQQLLPVQGGKLLLHGIPVNAPPGPQKQAFPNGFFAYAAVHEFLVNSKESSAATHGFLSALMPVLMKNAGALIWISSHACIFPPALAQYGIQPERIIFLQLQKPKEILWVMEEALRQQGLAAVVAEMQELNFAHSRRLQLAVEQSGAIGFVIRDEKNLSTTACVSRWRITHLPSSLPGGMPGVGFPRWQAELLKIRNGKPASWQVEWAHGQFKSLVPVQTFTAKEIRLQIA